MMKASLASKISEENSPDRGALVKSCLNEIELTVLRLAKKGIRELDLTAPDGRPPVFVSLGERGKNKVLDELRGAGYDVSRQSYTIHW